MKLGRYEIVRELGKGAMGIVYLAKDPLIGRLVALKTIRSSAHADDDETKEFQQRFVREAQAAGILNHPSIVTVHDIGQDDSSGMSFIAMEYVEGQNLKEVLSSGRALSFEQIADIIAQVAEGLDFAHAKGITHRDVKPANIILLEGLRAKITDFGIAKIASGGANLTTTGQFLGTPNYMAPEQIKGTAVDGRTDIFSLGICLYECLTRRKPFGGDSLTSISYKIVHEPFPPLQEVNPQIPDGFQDVVANCLQKDPARRYQRGRDMAAALRVVIRGERPVREEVVLPDETVLTRDRERVPTVEIPFPDSNSEDVFGLEAGAAAAPAASRASQKMPAAKAASPKRARGPAAAGLAKQFRGTLTNVRSSPAWKRSVPAAVFAGVILAAIAGLLLAVATIRRSQPAARVVDTRAEAKRMRERQLRIEANDLLRQGRVDDAYTRYQQLQQLEPSSPAVATMLQKLSAIRQQDMIGKQQLALAKSKYDQGLVLFNDRKFAEAVPLFEESFHLNPNSEDAAKYLKLAQQEQQRVEGQSASKRNAVRLASGQVVPGTTPVAAPATRGGGENRSYGGLSQFTTVFNGPFNDGYLQVKVGAQIAAHQNLWEERGRFLLRRKYPRPVNTTKEVTAADTDIEVWIVVPSANVQEHHVMRQNLQPGSQHKLVVTYDASGKRFDYQFN